MLRCHGEHLDLNVRVFETPNYVFHTALAECISKLYFNLHPQIVKYVNYTHFQLAYHLKCEYEMK